MGSTRLPGKVMKLVDGKNPSLFHTINQLKSCKTLDKIIVATTNENEDDIIENYVKNIGIDVFRGSSDDVLDRYFQCAKSNNFSAVVRITADCPIIDPNIVDEGVKIFSSGIYDYVTNTFPRSFPDGNETEVFSITSLKTAWRNSKLPSEREHVTPYFRNNAKIFRIKNFAFTSDISNLRWTVDYEEDVLLVKNLISKIKSRPIILSDILDVLKKHPEFIEINNAHNPDEGLKKSLEKDKQFLNS